MDLTRLYQKINYDTIVDRNRLDFVTYNKKFLQWDYVLNKGILRYTPEDLKNPVKKKQYNQVKLLLKDITIYSYAFFKDDDGNPFKLTAYQDAIGSCEHDFTPDNPNRLIVFKSSNQTGKSRFLDSLAIKLSLNCTNVNIVLVSNNIQASQFLLATIRHVLNNSAFADTWRMDLGETANTTMLTFTRDKGKIINRIICRPSGEGLLGYPVHYLFLDEADFYEDSKRFFWKVAYPRTNKTKGQIILFSNPNPDLARSDSLLYQLWTGNLCKRKFSFNFLDADWNTKTEFDNLRKEYPSYYFQSTFLGEFSVESGGFFKHKEIERMLVKDWDNVLPIVDRPVYLGIDFGKAKDNTCLVLGYVTDDTPFKLHIKYIKLYQLGTEYKTIVKDIRDIVDYYDKNYFGIGGIGFDATGVGKAIQEFFDEQGLTYTDITWTQVNKSKMYGDFKLFCEQDRINIVYTDKTEKQLSGLAFKKTPRGYLTVENTKSSVHDDIPSGIILFITVAAKPFNVTPGITSLAPDKEDDIVDDDGDSLILSSNSYTWSNDK